MTPENALHNLRKIIYHLKTESDHQIPQICGKESRIGVPVNGVDMLTGLFGNDNVRPIHGGESECR